MIRIGATREGTVSTVSSVCDQLSPRPASAIYNGNCSSDLVSRHPIEQVPPPTDDADGADANADSEWTDIRTGPSRRPFGIPRLSQACARYVELGEGIPERSVKCASRQRELPRRGGRAGNRIITRPSVCRMLSEIAVIAAARHSNLEARGMPPSQKLGVAICPYA
jgi:hypothetical protein